MNDTPCKVCHIKQPILKIHKCERCISCIVGINNEPNTFQKHLVTLYNNTAFNWKYPEVCTKCKQCKIVSDVPPYKRIYPQFDIKITPMHGSSICCECILELANNEYLFRTVC